MHMVRDLFCFILIFYGLFTHKFQNLLKYQWSNSTYSSALETTLKKIRNNLRESIVNHQHN